MCWEWKNINPLKHGGRIETRNVFDNLLFAIIPLKHGGRIETGSPRSDDSRLTLLRLKLDCWMIELLSCWILKLMAQS